MHSSHHEAMKCAVVWIQQQRYQGTGLSCPVPAIRAMHQNTPPFQTQSLDVTHNKLDHDQLGEGATSE